MEIFSIKIIPISTSSVLCTIFSHMYAEISDANFNEQLKIEVYIFMRDLLIFNMMIKRGIIAKFENQNIFVSNKYDGPYSLINLERYL